MNAIVLSAIWGVVMMFSGLFSKSNATVRVVATIGIAALLVGNILEMNGTRFLTVDVKNMMVFDNFCLLFNSIAFAATLIYFLLSGRDIEKVGLNVAEYFALIFFILCGISISSSFNNLLMLFLG